MTRQSPHGHGSIPDYFPDAEDVMAARPQPSSAERRRQAAAKAATWREREDALDWNPTSSVGRPGEYIADDFAIELGRHLPAGWTVASFNLWGPERTHHAGPVGQKATVEHVDDVQISVEPVSALPDKPGPQILNSHQVEREYADGRTELIADASTMSHRQHSATIYKVVVDAAAEFSARFDRWHSKPP